MQARCLFRCAQLILSLLKLGILRAKIISTLSYHRKHML